MKSLLVSLLAVAITAATVQAEKPKIEAIVAKDKDTKPANTFSADIPKIYAFFKSTGTKKGDSLRGAWIAVDVGDAAPKATKIDEVTVTAEQDNSSGSFSISKPTKGWPAGDYRIDIYDGSDLATSVKFTIEAAAGEVAEKEDEESGAAESDEGFAFKVHNTTKDKITKLLASEDGKEYGNFDIGAGIPPGKTITLKWDKKTDDGDCEWFFKAKFADGSESEAVKFDFCEEDLELEF